MINFGDSLASQKNYAEAERIYWSAYEKVKDVYAAKNPSFNLYAEGLTQNNPGDVYFLQSKFKQTQAAYHKALELWSRPEAQQTDLHRSPERIEWLREKISKTNQTS